MRGLERFSRKKEPRKETGPKVSYGRLTLFGQDPLDIHERAILIGSEVSHAEGRLSSDVSGGIIMFHMAGSEDQVKKGSVDLTVTRAVRNPSAALQTQPDQHTDTQIVRDFGLEKQYLADMYADYREKFGVTEDDLFIVGGNVTLTVEDPEVSVDAVYKSGAWSHEPGIGQKSTKKVVVYAEEFELKRR